jgi:hypothetical protein
MATKRQIQEILKMGVSRNTLSKMTLKEIKNLHESMVNAQGFVGMDKPIGRMTSVKESETKEVEEKKSYVAKPEEVKAGINVPPGTTKVRTNTDGTVEFTEGKKTTKKKVEQNPFGICTTSLGLKGKKKDDYTKGEKKKFERCVLDVKKSLKEGKNPYDVILEQKMREIVESNLRPTMTKKDLINSILESKTKEKTKEKEKTTTPTRKNPFKPAPDTEPRPKGSGTKEKERTKEKEKTTTPTRKNPFQPAPNTEPRPKGELPSYLSFGKMNIKLKGE